MNLRVVVSDTTDGRTAQNDRRAAVAVRCVGTHKKGKKTREETPDEDNTAQTKRRRSVPLRTKVSSFPGFLFGWLCLYG